MEKRDKDNTSDAQAPNDEKPSAGQEDSKMQKTQESENVLDTAFDDGTQKTTNRLPETPIRRTTTFNPELERIFRHSPRSAESFEVLLSRSSEDMNFHRHEEQGPSTVQPILNQESQAHLSESFVQNVNSGLQIGEGASTSRRSPPSLDVFLTPVDPEESERSLHIVETVPSVVPERVWNLLDVPEEKKEEENVRSVDPFLTSEGSAKAASQHSMDSAGTPSGFSGLGYRWERSPRPSSSVDSFNCGDGQTAVRSTSTVLPQKETLERGAQKSKSAPGGINTQKEMHSDSTTTVDSLFELLDQSASSDNVAQPSNNEEGSGRSVILASPSASSSEDSGARRTDPAERFIDTASSASDPISQEYFIEESEDEEDETEEPPKKKKK